MSDAESRVGGELPPSGGVAWLDISAERTGAWPGRPLTGPLSLQITPLGHSRSPYYFRGARLRGARCIWAAATVSGAELHRAARAERPDRPDRVDRAAPGGADAGIQLLARVDCAGSVFDPVGQPGAGVFTVHDPAEPIREVFATNAHVFTIDAGRAQLGLEAATLAELAGQSFDLTPFQLQLMRSALGLLVTGSDELSTATSLVGVDRYLGALAGLLLRTAVRRPGTDVEQMELIRSRCDTIISEQATDPLLSPARIATTLSISLRQLYRAFHGTESPAARIRRRRLEQAAEILAGRQGPAQVESVAQDCGFVSAEYFSRAFRREFGMSPRAYRSAHKQRPVAVADAVSQP